MNLDYLSRHLLILSCRSNSHHLHLRAASSFGSVPAAADHLNATSGATVLAREQPRRTGRVQSGHLMSDIYLTRTRRYRRKIGVGYLLVY